LCKAYDILSVLNQLELKDGHGKSGYLVYIDALAAITSYISLYPLWQSPIAKARLVLN